MNKNVVKILKTLSCLVFLGTLAITGISVEAADEEFDIDNVKLYEQTNTFGYKLNNNGDNSNVKTTLYNFDNEERYLFDRPKEDVEVDNGKPLLTVLTHGLGGSAADWSNYSKRFDFGFSEDSLITRLARKGDCNIYWIKFDENEYTFSLRDITSEVYLGMTGQRISFNKYNIGHITDISKHSIVVFDANSDVYMNNNDAVYTEFNYAISRLVYDIKKLNNNKLPKINLIGHSRGGITNMQYALDHPDLVDSMYSLGTPYMGTTSGSIGYLLKPSMLGDAADDLLIPTNYKKYMKRWNDGYDQYYNHINVNAYAGYSTHDQIVKLLGMDLTWENLIPNYDKWNDISKNALKFGAVLVANELYSYFISSVLSGGLLNPLIIGKAISGAISEVIQNFNINSIEWPIADIVEILTNEINFDYHYPFVSFYNDFCVDLGSQLGYEGLVSVIGDEYKGFKRTIKAFNSCNCDTNVLSRDMPAVPHNMEARDKELNNYILADIKLGSYQNNYITRKMYDENGVDTNCVYIEQFLGDIAGDTYYIPSKIDGKTVKGISDYAFANNCYGKNNIKKIVIPNTVEYIGKNAFYNSENLTNVEFEKNSSLKEIDDYAFSNIANLKSFEISSSILDISENSFDYTPITSFTCNNSRYGWINNVLIDKDIIGDYENEYRAIYVNPEATIINMPNNVRTIRQGLFKCNQNIKEVNLNDVTYIEAEAFFCSSIEEIKGINEALIVENYAFENTPFIENYNGNIIKIGSTLINYSDDSDIIIIDDDIKTINANCFKSNAKGIVIGENVEVIGEKAFINCPYLEWILFKSNKQALLSENIINENVKIYVPKAYLDKYRNFETFKQYSSQLDTKKINVTFDYEEKTTIVVDYYSKFDNYIEAPIKSDEAFVYWIINNDENNQIRPNEIFDFLEDVTLSPHYEHEIRLNFTDFDNNYNDNIEYGKSIDIPYKDGYLFIGWYDINDNLVVDIDGNVNWNLVKNEGQLFAKYEILNYRISFNYNGGTIGEDIIYSFNAVDIVNNSDIKEPVKFGYIFDFWELNGNKFTNTKNIFENITLTARWLGDEIKPSQSRTNIAINKEYAILNMQTAKDKKYEINILNKVKTIAVLGAGKSFSNIKITVFNRTNPLIFGLEDITLCAPKSTSSTSCDAIHCYGEATVYLNINGIVNIYGGNGKDGDYNYKVPEQATDNNDGEDGIKGQNGYKGGSGIVAYKLIVDSLSSNSILNVYGGNGGNGGNGSHGQQGSDGVNGPSGWFWKPVKGDNGSNGGDGGLGGNGGNGGNAIAVSGVNNLYVSDSLNYYFKGGDGGNGGEGGIGGRGGDGASDTNSSAFSGVGDPGDGGNGGNGGSGGTGGNGALATNALNIMGYGGAAGEGGIGGRGGYQGHGGDAGQNGSNGNKGSLGLSGSNGTNGQNGITGVNTIESLDGLKNSGYMFNKKFINKIMQIS